MDGPGRVLRIPPGPSRCAGLRSTTEAATTLSPDILKRHYRSLDMAIRQLDILRIRGDNRASFNDQIIRSTKDRIQCLKCRVPVKIMATSRSSHAAITLSSFFDPPG